MRLFFSYKYFLIYFLKIVLLALLRGDKLCEVKRTKLFVQCNIDSAFDLVRWFTVWISIYCATGRG